MPTRHLGRSAFHLSCRAERLASVRVLFCVCCSLRSVDVADDFGAVVVRVSVHVVLAERPPLLVGSAAEASSRLQVRGMMADRRPTRHGARDGDADPNQQGPSLQEGGQLRLTSEVLSYMESVGDANLVFASTALTLAVPRTLHHARTAIGTTAAPTFAGPAGTFSPSRNVKSAIVSCHLLARDSEAVLAVGTKSVYLLPAERIPIDDILEFVVHTHCNTAFHALEIRVSNPDGTCDVRFVALSSEYMLRQAVAVVQTACPFARVVFHSHKWIAKDRPRRGGGGASDYSAVDFDSDQDDEGAAIPGLRRRQVVVDRASPTAQRKLAAYRKQRMHADATVARVNDYGPGRYSEAVDALNDDLSRMMREVDRMLEATGDPQPILRLEREAREPRRPGGRSANDGNEAATAGSSPTAGSASSVMGRPRRSAMLRNNALRTADAPHDFR